MANDFMQVKPKEHTERLAFKIKQEDIQKRFQEVLGKRAPAFVSSVITVVNQDKLLGTADPMSIITSAMIAASLDLPINKDLGFAWIIPYKGQCQFQIGYRGFIQLAMRSGQYRIINANVLYEGMVLSRDHLRGTIEIDKNEKNWNKDKIEGYFSYFETLNGMQKLVEMTTENAHAHAKKYSQSYNSKFSPWQTNFDEMATKTVIKKLLKTWGILSIDMQMQHALIADQSTGIVDGEYVYGDNNAVDIEKNAEEKEPKEKVKGPSRAKAVVEETENVAEFDEGDVPKV